MNPAITQGMKHDDTFAYLCILALVAMFFANPLLWN